MRSHVVSHHQAFRVLWQKETTWADRTRKAEQKKLKAEERFDRHSLKLPELPVGDSVRTQHRVQEQWQNIGEINKESHGGRSFFVRSEKWKGSLA